MKKWLVIVVGLTLLAVVLFILLVASPTLVRPSIIPLRNR